MKISDIAFYSICLAFGLFNNFSGIANIAYVMLALTCAVVACVLLKKYDEKFKNRFKTLLKR